MESHDTQKLRPWRGTTAAPLTVVDLFTFPWRGELLKKLRWKTFQNRGGLFTRLHGRSDGLTDDCPIMSGQDSLAKRLCQVSPYAGRIESLIGLIPEIMERNDQLRPLWTAWRQNATPDLTPRQYFARDQIKVLCDFVEYLYFASDAFARLARTRR